MLIVEIVAVDESGIEPFASLDHPQVVIAVERTCLNRQAHS